MFKGAAFLREEKIKPIGIILVICAVLGVAMCIDLVHATLKDYHFYPSESLLFSSFWVLFVPILIFYQKLVTRRSSAWKFAFPIPATILHLSLFAIIVNLCSGWFYNHTFSLGSIFTESIAEHGLSCILVYGLVTALPRFQKRDSVDPEKGQKIRVKHRENYIMLDCAVVLYAKTDRPYTALVTRDQTYLEMLSLRKLEAEYLPEHFIRVHKSTIVNTHYIQSYTSRQNGDYDVKMSNGDILRVSRNFNGFFRAGRNPTGERGLYSS